METEQKKKRCAIYTRKSVDEGLEMEFNSLDAQRAACEAYIESQKAMRNMPAISQNDMASPFLRKEPSINIHIGYELCIHNGAV